MFKKLINFILVLFINLLGCKNTNNIEEEDNFKNIERINIPQQESKENANLKKDDTNLEKSMIKPENENFPQNKSQNINLNNTKNTYSSIKEENEPKKNEIINMNTEKKRPIYIISKNEFLKDNNILGNRVNNSHNLRNDFNQKDSGEKNISANENTIKQKIDQEKNNSQDEGITNQINNSNISHIKNESGNSPEKAIHSQTKFLNKENLQNNSKTNQIVIDEKNNVPIGKNDILRNIDLNLNKLNNQDNLDPRDKLQNNSSANNLNQNEQIDHNDENIIKSLKTSSKERLQKAAEKINSKVLYKFDLSIKLPERNVTLEKGILEVANVGTLNAANALCFIFLAINETDTKYWLGLEKVRKLYRYFWKNIAYEKQQKVLLDINYKIEQVINSNELLTGEEVDTEIENNECFERLERIKKELLKSLKEFNLNKLLKEDKKNSAKNLANKTSEILCLSYLYKKLFNKSNDLQTEYVNIKMVCTKLKNVLEHYLQLEEKHDYTKNEKKEIKENIALLKNRLFFIKKFLLI